MDYNDHTFNENGTVSDNDNVKGTVNTVRRTIIKKITVDMVAPKVEVRFEDKAPVYTDEPSGRQYFDGSRTVTVTVVEHNFKEGVDNKTSRFYGGLMSHDISAKDCAEKDAYGVSKDAIFDYFNTIDNWREIGVDTYQASYTFGLDANYSFTFNYKDPANNAYHGTPQLFTVDTHAPHDLKVTISRNPVNTTGNYCYYNSSVRVTISAVDETSGINFAKYDVVRPSTVNGYPTSNVNDNSYGMDAGASVKQNGTTFYVEFNVPLIEGRQFTGNVEFEMTDIVKHTTGYKDQRIIVVGRFRRAGR